MKRAIIILLAGLLSGVAAHESWFTARQPGPSNSLDAQLLWMRTYLRLDGEQYARLKVLHEELSPKLRELGEEVARARLTSRAFEERRRRSGEVDFLAFAQFVRERREVDAECSESTRGLVAAALSVMTPEQRNRYLEMVTPVIEAPPGGSLD